MKKRFRKLLALTVSLVLVVSGCVVFAENTIDEVTPAEKIENIVESIEFFSRYDSVNAASLYKSALDEVVNNNPELYEAALKAMLSSIDENSVYYNETEAKKLFEELNDEITGIGVNVIAGDGDIIVTQPIPESPAYKAGIKAGDIIIGADNVDLRGMDFDTAINYIRGEVGTKVRIKILRSGIPEPLEFLIAREKVLSSPLDYEVVEKNGKKIMVITLYSFTDTSFEHFKEALNKADAEKITNIIIDLRNNGGGYLEQAIEIANLFLPKDALITTEEHKYEIFNRRYFADGSGKKYNTVVLINGISASASEVLTAALSENGVARVIGEKSYGKGTVQTIVGAPDNAVLKYTTAFYTTPKGNNIHEIGITPDIKVENSTTPVDMSEFNEFTLSRVYKIGEVNEEIKNAKKMLEKLGVFLGEINDVYDENLKIAVTTYQKIQGLFPYGVLDITTQHNLYETLRMSEVVVDDQMEMAINMF